MAEHEPTALITRNRAIHPAFKLASTPQTGASIERDLQDPVAAFSWARVMSASADLQARRDPRSSSPRLRTRILVLPCFNLFHAPRLPRHYSGRSGSIV